MVADGRPVADARPGPPLRGSTVEEHPQADGPEQARDRCSATTWTWRASQCSAWTPQNMAGSVRSQSGGCVLVA